LKEVFAYLKACLMGGKLPVLDPVELTNVDEGPLDFKGFATDSTCEPIAWGVFVPTIFHGKKKAPN
jgi:hypothetical protein